MKTMDMTCRLSSEAVGESLAGTAPVATRWLLVEHNGAWGRKALEESDIAPEVQAALLRLVAEVPQGRLGLIKQGGPSARLRVFAVTCRPGRLVKYEVESLADLLPADGPALFAGTWPGATPVADPLYIVCTNGKRDRCCASYGTPVYRSLLASGHDVWQTTHVGGHRFAATMGCFPEGWFYGRLDAAQAGQVVASHRAGQVELAWCRGRTVWPAAVQAAEILFRQAQQQTGSDFIRSASWEQGEGRTRVTFVLPDGIEAHVEVEAVAGTQTVIASCGAAQGDPTTEYRLAGVPTMEKG